MTPELEIKLSATLQHELLARYALAARDAEVSPLDMYLWNLELAESFHHSLHFAEVVSRNAVHQTLLCRLGEEWYDNTTFLRLLSPPNKPSDGHYVQALNGAVRTAKRKYGDDFTSHHLVIKLNFGFWNHIAAKRFRRMLWSNGISQCLPHAPHTATDASLFRLIESVRRWRNRVAHHKALFDKDPARKHDDALRLIGWCCLDTARMVRKKSKVSDVINMRPKNGDKNG